MASSPAHDSGLGAQDKHFDIGKQKTWIFMPTLKKTGKDQFSVGVDYLLFSNPKKHSWQGTGLHESRECSWRRHLSFLGHHWMSFCLAGNPTSSNFSRTCCEMGSPLWVPLLLIQQWNAREASSVLWAVSISMGSFNRSQIRGPLV